MYYMVLIIAVIAIPLHGAAIQKAPTATSTQPMQGVYLLNETNWPLQISYTSQSGTATSMFLRPSAQWLIPDNVLNFSSIVPTSTYGATGRWGNYLTSVAAKSIGYVGYMDTVKKQASALDLHFQEPKPVPIDAINLFLTHAREQLQSTEAAVTLCIRQEVDQEHAINELVPSVRTVAAEPWYYEQQNLLDQANELKVRFINIVEAYGVDQGEQLIDQYYETITRIKELAEEACKKAGKRSDLIPKKLREGWKNLLLQVKNYVDDFNYFHEEYTYAEYQKLVFENLAQAKLDQDVQTVAKYLGIPYNAPFREVIGALQRINAQIQQDSKEALAPTLSLKVLQHRQVSYLTSLPLRWAIFSAYTRGQAAYEALRRYAHEKYPRVLSGGELQDAFRTAMACFY